MSNLRKLIERRQSCRNFQTKPVPIELIENCIDAARLAPSACNSQPWKFIVINEPSRSEQVALALQEGGMNRFAKNCPAFIVVVECSQNITAKVGERLKNQQYAGIDLGLATANLTLMATEQGLDSCILGWFDERKLRMLLHIPKTRRVRLVVALGYRSEEDVLREKIRKPLSEVMSLNKF